MKFCLLILTILAVVVNGNTKANVLQFENLGYSGTYNPVLELKNIDSDSCTCVLGDPVAFNGTAAPLNEQLSVHFRGPLILHKFAAYYSPNFITNNDNSDSWNRIAYYDDSQGTANNVTFLTNAGANSSCLGNGLSYAGSDGISKASSATILGENTLIHSNEEFVIFSNLSCGSSSLQGDCGVYRPNIPAFKGYDGTVKMFLFEFEMPQENNGNEDIINYNSPAIWLLNAQIPRTSQYSMNSNCSCWASGCGEFDIFEIMNNTHSTELLTTIHDYQGTDNINTGIIIPGYIERNFNSVMKGGVIFDNSGNAVVFMSNSTTFNNTITAATANGWISKAGNVVNDALSSVSYVPPKSSSKSKGDAGQIDKSFMSQITLGIFSLIFWLT